MSTLRFKDAGAVQPHKDFPLGDVRVSLEAFCGKSLCGPSYLAAYSFSHASQTVTPKVSLRLNRPQARRIAQRISYATHHPTPQYSSGILIFPGQPQLTGTGRTVTPKVSLRLNRPQARRIAQRISYATHHSTPQYSSGILIFPGQPQLAGTELTVTLEGGITQARWPSQVCEHRRDGLDSTELPSAWERLPKNGSSARFTWTNIFRNGDSAQFPSWSASAIRKMGPISGQPTLGHLFGLRRALRSAVFIREPKNRLTVLRTEASTQVAPFFLQRSLNAGCARQRYPGFWASKTKTSFVTAGNRVHNAFPLGSKRSVVEEREWHGPQNNRGKKAVQDAPPKFSLRRRTIS